MVFFPFKDRFIEVHPPQITQMRSQYEHEL